jgi:DNA-binding IclR family transcriptional regulator
VDRNVFCDTQQFSGTVAIVNDASVGVQSVDRALTILEVLARVGEAGVTEIAGELAVHKSTAFRLVSTGRYRLGVGVLRLAGATTARLDLVQEARPVCRQLAADTGETVNIAVLSDSSALYLDQVAGSSALQPHNWVGQHIPLHATSNGKVLLSGLDDERVAELLGTLSRYTPMTITRRTRLREELGEVRDRGYAVAVDELEEGLTAVAAPIRNAHGDVVASMSVSGPTFRLTDARVDDVVPLLVEASGEVSHRLGWGQR